MRIRKTMILAALVALTGGFALRAASPPIPPPAGEAPRLVLLVAVDQMRYDYLPRFAGRFTGGFKKLMDGGAVFTNAHLDHYPSVTAVGHMAMLTGAPPSVSGIIGNDWYDRREKRNVTSVEDPGTVRLGAAEATGSSPHRLMVSTVGDELKMAHPASRVVSLSFKDRSAILMGGRMADVALWWDTESGAYVSSTWYGDALPEWAEVFNATRPADAWVGKEWRAVGGELLGRLPDAPGPGYYAGVYNSAFGNDLLVSLAQAALEGESLGRRDATDILAVSFSCNDAVGHGKGPHSPQVEDITVRTDLALGRLLETIDRQVGLNRTLVVVTADHGVAPVPEQMEEWRMPGGRYSREDLEGAAASALAAAFGPGAWVEGRAGSALYLNRDLVAEKGLDPATVQRVLADGIEAVAPTWRAYTRSQLIEGRVPPDPWSRRVLLSFHRVRSGDVEVLLEPYWMSATAGTTHGTPWSYDTHIPLMLMGPGIQPGRYHRAVLLNDLAPTQATILGVEAPSGASGHALAEAMTP
ncbi:MAG: alkaline phosphatase family protein [Acidobacteria bacterium]|nr:alkaline phosphatase family protein [Acidobacteriota bacterium]